MPTKRSTKSAKSGKKVSLPTKALSAKKAKGVKGGSFSWGITRGVREKWID